MVLENQAQQTAQELNEERRLLVIRPDWSRVVQDVIAVDLDIKWWRGETKLRQVGVITRGELLSLGRTPRSARALEVPDRIDEAAVRRARRELLRPASTEVLTLLLRSPRRVAEREEVVASL